MGFVDMNENVKYPQTSFTGLGICKDPVKCVLQEFLFSGNKFSLLYMQCGWLGMQMALGQGISVYGGQQWGTVHVNNQPMIVLLVPFRKGGLGGGRGLGTMGTHQRFTSYLFLFFSLLTHLQLVLSHLSPKLDSPLQLTLLKETWEEHNIRINRFCRYNWRYEEGQGRQVCGEGLTGCKEKFEIIKIHFLR